MFSLSTIVELPPPLVFGQFLQPAMLWSSLGVTIVALSACTLLANLSFVYLIDLAGPIFASQVNYVTAMFGIFWRMLLLGERLSVSSWTAIFLVILGVIFVGAKSSDKPITINRNYQG